MIFHLQNSLIMGTNSLYVILGIPFAIIMVIVAIIAWRNSDFFIAPREHWRKSKLDIFKLKLDNTAKILGHATGIFFILVILLYAGITGIYSKFFKTPENSNRDKRTQDSIVASKNSANMKADTQIAQANNKPNPSLISTNSNDDNLPNKDNAVPVQVDSLQKPQLVEKQELKKDSTLNKPQFKNDTISSKPKEVLKITKETPEYKRMVVAVEMLKRGKSIKEVADSTFLTKHQVKKLKQDNNL
jgi:hypothetical protein